MKRMNVNLEKEKMFYHALALAYEPFHKNLAKRFEKTKSYEKIFEEDREQNAVPGLRNIEAQKEYQKLERAGIRLLLLKDPEYPPLLSKISDAPLGIYIKGSADALRAPSLAIVGTRKASTYGKEIAFEFAEKLAQCGVSIVSGLALGIDSEAHRGALAGRGRTVGVLGSGLLHLTPPSNKTLGERIVAAEGALVSEFPPESDAPAWHFPLRNRIIAGIAETLLVIEAPKKSGSLITARFSLKQNKKVFVIPSDINRSGFEGSHALIRDGAILISSPEELFESLHINVQKELSTGNLLSKDEDVIYRLIARGVDDAEALAQNSGERYVKVLGILSMLENKKIIKNIGGKFFLRK